MHIWKLNDLWISFFLLTSIIFSNISTISDKKHLLSVGTKADSRENKSEPLFERMCNKNIICDILNNKVCTTIEQGFTTMCILCFYNWIKNQFCPYKSYVPEI